MASDIVSVLGLESSCESKVIIVKELNHCDSSFIISCALNHCMKNKNALILISAHNSLQHFQQVGLKMNCNIQKHIDSGLMTFFDLSEELAISFLLDHPSCLQYCYLKIEENINKMLETNKTVNIIIEGISHMFDLNYTLKEVNIFCNKIIQLNRTLSNSFLIFDCNIACDDDVTYVLATLLSHKAYTVLEVDNLPSGWSADVSGHLIVKYPGLKFNEEHMFNFEQKSVKYLFKLFDRGVKLLAPGTV